MLEFRTDCTELTAAPHQGPPLCWVIFRLIVRSLPRAGLERRGRPQGKGRVDLVRYLGQLVLHRPLSF